VAYTPTDQQVRQALEEAHEADGLRAFDHRWHRLERSPRDLRAKKALAHLYAQFMHASGLTESDHEKFQGCVEVGRRAIDLHPFSCAAYEQLGIAYSVIQAPLAEARRCVDQTVRLGRIAPLAVKPPTFQCRWKDDGFHASPDFYFVYWRLFRSDPSRKRQVDWALERYLGFDESQRSFDRKLADLRALERVLGSEQDDRLNCCRGQEKTLKAPAGASP
jgi:hypothetical protein